MWDYDTGQLTFAGPIIAYPSFPHAASRTTQPADIKDTSYVGGSDAGSYVGIGGDPFLRDDQGRIIMTDGGDYILTG